MTKSWTTALTPCRHCGMIDTVDFREVINDEYRDTEYRCWDCGFKWVREAAVAEVLYIGS